MYTKIKCKDLMFTKIEVHGVKEIFLKNILIHQVSPLSFNGKWDSHFYSQLHKDLMYSKITLKDVNL